MLSGESQGNVEPSASSFSAWKSEVWSVEWGLLLRLELECLWDMKASLTLQNLELEGKTESQSSVHE